MKSRILKYWPEALGVLLVLILVAGVTFVGAQQTTFSPNGIRGAFAGNLWVPAPFALYQNTFNSISACAGKGTSANPSVATCASAPTGFASCATNASGVASGCVINTTAVTANSQIDVTEDSSLGTALGVTCNTSVITLTPSARSAGVSFSVTPGTITTNPVCFSYTITN